jgi:hypothetical protein
VRDFLDLQVRGSVDSSAVVEHLRKALSVHGEAKPEALESGLNTLATSDLRPTLPHVRTPTLVIAGQNDRITAPGASRVLAAALPDARYVEMRRAAHAPFLSHRKEFTAALEQFLRAGEDVRALDDVGTIDPTGGGGRATASSAVAMTAAPATTASVAATNQAERVGKSLANEAKAPRFKGDGRSDRGATAASAAKGSNAVVPVKGGARAAKKKKRMKARARKKLQASSR